MKSEVTIKVTIWNEGRHEKLQPNVGSNLPKWHPRRDFRRLRERRLCHPLLGALNVKSYPARRLEIWKAQRKIETANLSSARSIVQYGLTQI
jgi:hypothetical protein